MVRKAEDWKWSSLSQRLGRLTMPDVEMEDGPSPWPRNWVKLVNDPQTEAELSALRRCAERGQPFGSDA
jgi:hypothetical protein